LYIITLYKLYCDSKNLKSGSSTASSEGLEAEVLPPETPSPKKQKVILKVGKGKNK
jgi:hypothetical protein